MLLFKYYYIFLYAFYSDFSSVTSRTFFREIFPCSLLFFTPFHIDQRTLYIFFVFVVSHFYWGFPLRANELID